MTVILQKLIEALRNELEQYGEMLALLEQQQEAAVDAEPQEPVTETVQVCVT